MSTASKGPVPQRLDSALRSQDCEVASVVSDAGPSALQIDGASDGLSIVQAPVPAGV